MGRFVSFGRVPGTVPLKPWQKILLIAGLIWAALVIVPDVYRLHWDLSEFDFQTNNDGLIYAVPDTPKDAPPKEILAENDHIALTPGPCWHPFSVACSNMLAVFGGMGGLSYVWHGTVTTLPIIHGHKKLPMTFRAEPAPLNPYVAIGLAFDEAAGVLVLGLAFWLAWVRPGRMTTGFFLYAMWFNPGQYFTTYAFLQRFPILLMAQEVCQALAQGAGYAGFVIFAARFPHDRREQTLPGIELVAVFLGVLSVVLQTLSFTNVLGFHTETITRIAILGGYGVAIFAALIAWYRLKLQAPTDYQRMLWILSGCVIGIPAFVFADTSESTTVLHGVWQWPLWNNHPPGELTFEVCYLLSGVLAIFTCLAVLRRRIMSVTIELQAICVSGAVIILGVMAEDWIKEPISDTLHRIGMNVELQFAISIGVLVALAYMSHQLAHSASHLFNRKFYHAIDHLAALGRTMNQAESVEAVDQVLVSGPSGCLSLASAACFREITGTYRLVAEAGGWTTKHLENLPAWNHGLMENMRKGAVMRLQPPTLSDDPRPEEIAAPALALPIVFAGKLYAVALYGGHNSGTDFERTEIKTLEKFAQDMAIGYEVVHLRLLQEENRMLRIQLLEAGFGTV